MLVFSELIHVLKGQGNQVSTFSQSGLEKENLLLLFAEHLGFSLGLKIG